MKTEFESSIIKQINKLGGRYYWEHKGHYNLSRLSTVWLIINNKCYFGESVCMPNLRFTKKQGRIIALSRALDNYKKKKSIPFPELLKKKNVL